MIRRLKESGEEGQVHSGREFNSLIAYSIKDLGKKWMYGMVSEDWREHCGGQECRRMENKAFFKEKD